VDVALAGRRFSATLFGLFAGVALVLTVAGLYGVLAFVFGQRRREIGVRVAVGASAASVTALVLRRGATLLFVGAAVGLGGGLVAGRLLRGLLVGVPPFDPRTSLSWVRSWSASEGLRASSRRSGPRGWTRSRRCAKGRHAGSSLARLCRETDYPQRLCALCEAPGCPDVQIDSSLPKPWGPFPHLVGSVSVGQRW
jgi:hypothetical protein